MNNNLCPYAKDESGFIEKKLACTLTHNHCAFGKYCVTEHRMKMSPLYTQYGCREKNKFEYTQIGGEDMKEKKSSVRKNVVAEDKKDDVAKIKSAESFNVITRKLHACVAYNSPAKNRTAIKYIEDNSTYSVFIDGIYNGDLLITYHGDRFAPANIIKIEEE